MNVQPCSARYSTEVARCRNWKTLQSYHLLGFIVKTIYSFLGTYRSGEETDTQTNSQKTGLLAGLWARTQRRQLLTFSSG